MDGFRHVPPAVGGLERSTARTVFALFLTGLVALLLLGSLTVPAHRAPPAGIAAGAHPGPMRLAVAPAPTPRFGPSVGPHGDLIVGPTNSPFYIEPTTAGSSVYYQQGNISVLPGGTLVVRNETLVFEEFVSTTGSVAQRLSHIYWFSVRGNLDVWNSTVTTDAKILNFYPKLSFNVSGAGTATLVHSSFQFPGTVNVYGPAATLRLNASNITRNYAILSVVENTSLFHDSISAAATTVSGGAHLDLWDSAIVNLYRDNTTRWGQPTSAPVYNNAPHTISSGGGANWNSWSWVTSTDSENLTRLVSNPAIGGAALSITYSAPYAQFSTGANSFTFGSAYPLGGITYSGASPLIVPLPAGAVGAINAAGVLGYLNATGVFGGPTTVSVTLGATNGSANIGVSNVQILLYPLLDYNVTATGPGSTITAVDSKIDLNWNLTPGTPVGIGARVPASWNSQKLLLLDGAQGYFANLTVSSAYLGVYWNASAILPDATSAAYYYRWIDFPVTGAGGSPLVGAQLQAFYSYDTSQINNATATSMNNLASADPSLSSYVAAWLAERHIAAYGLTDGQGMGSLLLLAGVLAQTTLPDGTFLGQYHVAVTLAGGGPNSTQWISASATPYTAGMTPAAADVAATTAYPNYRPLLTVGTLSFAVEGAHVSPATVDIGQSLVVSGVVTNVGVGPVPAFSANLSYVVGAHFPRTLVAANQTFGSLASGKSVNVSFSWLVSETVVGVRGVVPAQLVLEVVWNGGSGPVGGIAEQQFNVTVRPSPISLDFTAPSGSYPTEQDIPVNGSVGFAGRGFALINVTAVLPSGQSFQIGQYQAQPGTFDGFVSVYPSMPSGTYSLNVTAYYNTVTVSKVYPAQFTLGTATTGSSPSFLDQKFLGLSVLYWILIAVGAAALLSFLFLYLLPQQARGKLVECGECGSLIPETADRCPKCGAEFEADLVRCSRCGSTIPSTSQVCPECAAQLLGKPDEGSKDPERQGYADFVERFRTESKKELGDNYSEGAFWDWWKRQQSYVSFSQWRLQQSAGSRVGMGAPVVSESVAPPEPTPSSPPKRGGGGGAMAASATRPAGKPAAAASGSAPPSRPSTAPRPAATPAAATSGGAAAAPSAGEGGMKPCQNCGKEIPPDYLVCPFCGAVTR